MKKITLLFLAFTSISIFTDAQIQLWGMTTRGGASSDGNIFKCIPSTKSYSSVTEFNSSTGAAPFGSLIQGSDGNMYGMTRDGGHADYGTIFKCTASGSLTTIAYFNDSNGATPYGDLIMGSDGNLYGMTTYGGGYGYGTIFQCTPSGTINNLVVFYGPNGMYPNGNLIQGKDGNLYGMASYGGDSGDSGVIFKCTTSGIYTVLDTFKSTNGGNPNGSLIQGIDGNLYGMTMYGGTADSGTIFKCTTEGVLTTIYNFNTASGCFPYGSLVQGYDGNLYGLTETGGASNYGTVFKCTTSGILTTLVTFDGTNGENPLGSIMLASDSNLYGMTSEGGPGGAGTIFQCTTSGTLTTIGNLVGVVYACDPVRQYGTLTEINPVLGINNIESSSKINMYPNPAHDILNLSFDTQGASNTAITITDITGKEIINTNEVISNDQTVSINISALSYGMYFAKVTTDKNTQVFKFIKN
ncbi:MAG TPA: choice-of-anchor tandem repeat GloVer-containing protein [Bacteroidia bacterium]|jgi:uncharacterized repeat protein (TIGR03803 family)|nr:choice-of-anchor tandem repeat GloVer-containing protein [Bacteroidia bacterium]